jgi:glutathione S-transferase kappa 1
MKVRYLFDVVSPYSALSTKVLLRYKAEWGLQLELVPVFLGGIMQATGNKPPAMLAARAMFQGKDLERQAKLFRVPLLPTPSNFFSSVARDTIQCQRLLCAALGAG